MTLIHEERDLIAVHDHTHVAYHYLRSHILRERLLPLLVFTENIVFVNKIELYS